MKRILAGLIVLVFMVLAVLGAVAEQSTPSSPVELSSELLDILDALGQSAEGVLPNLKSGCWLCCNIQTRTCSPCCIAKYHGEASLPEGTTVIMLPAVGGSHGSGSQQERR